MKGLKLGDRVRLKVDALIARKGTTGTIIRVDYYGYENGYTFLKDGSSESCDAFHDELAKMQDQTPNPEHSRYLFARGLA